jgi:hypothetical protein
LLEDGAHDGRHHASRGARHEILGIAGEVDPAALPCGAEELLVHGLHKTAVVVADDEPDTGQPTLDEARDWSYPAFVDGQR